MRNFIGDNIMFEIIDTKYNGRCGKIQEIPVAIPLNNLDDEDSDDHFQDLLIKYNKIRYKPS